MSLVVKETSKCRGKINTFLFIHWIKESMCRSEHWLKSNCWSCLSLFLQIEKLQNVSPFYLLPLLRSLTHPSSGCVLASETSRLSLPSPPHPHTPRHGLATLIQQSHLCLPKRQLQKAGSRVWLRQHKTSQSLPTSTRAALPPGCALRQASPLLSNSRCEQHWVLWEVEKRWKNVSELEEVLSGGDPGHSPMEMTWGCRKWYSMRSGALEPDSLGLNPVCVWWLYDLGKLLTFPI